MISIKGLPFAPKGAVDVSDCHTAAEVIEKAKLDYQVAKCKLVANMPFEPEKLSNLELDILNSNIEEGSSFLYDGRMFADVPDSYSTYRTDINIPFGVVKSKYEVVQNKAAFEFFNDAIGRDKAIWQTAGAFGDGERIFVSAKLPNDFKVKGDEINNYLVFTNSHDGTSGVKILFTPIRVVCQNTLNAAIRTSDNYVTFRHTQSVHGNIMTAKDLLQITSAKTEEVKEMLEYISNIKINDEIGYDYLGKVFLSQSEYEKVKELDSKLGFYKVTNLYGTILDDAGISTRKANMIHNTWEYYHDGPGQKEIMGTAYGLYNAVTGYFSNVANLEGTKRMDSLLYGNGDKITSEALQYAIQL